MDYRQTIGTDSRVQTGQETDSAGFLDQFDDSQDTQDTQQDADVTTVQGFKNSIESPDWDPNRYSENMRSGDIEAVSINTDPNPVQSGGTAEITFNLTNRALFVDPVLDPAYCDPQDYITSTGLTAEMYVNPQWSPEISDSMCIPLQVSQSNFSKTFTLVAPEIPTEAQFNEVSLPVDVTVRQPGNDFKTKTIDIIVERGTRAPSDPRDEERGDGNGGGGGGIGNTIVSTVVNNPIESALAVGAIGAALRFIPGE
jgi:hypothetical protein